jgi:hypothetical protein
VSPGEVWRDLNALDARVWLFAVGTFAVLVVMLSLVAIFS